LLGYDYFSCQFFIETYKQLVLDSIFTINSYTGSDCAQLLNGTDGTEINYKTCQIAANPSDLNYFARSQCTSAGGSALACFAGSETVMLESGGTKNMRDVEIGDRVLVASMDGKSTTYSPVVGFPHAAAGNTEEAEFLNIVTTTGRDIKLTKDHLILSGACGTELGLIAAASVKESFCVRTVSGEEIVSEIKRSYGEGVFTVVTLDQGLIVVNGFVASSFSSNHHVANAFYNIHRALYLIAPSLATVNILLAPVKAFGDVIASIFA